VTDTDKVVTLRKAPEGIVPGDAVNHSVVEILEKYLNQARRGEITGLAAAIVRPNHTVATFWSSTEQGHAVLGAIAVLQHEYARDTLSRT